MSKYIDVVNQIKEDNLGYKYQKAKCAQMHILETSPKLSLLKTLTIVLLYCFQVLLCRESVHKLCYYLADFRPLLCIHPGDISPESAFFLVEPETSIFKEVSSLFTLNQ